MQLTIFNSAGTQKSCDDLVCVPIQTFNCSTPGDYHGVTVEWSTKSGELYYVLVHGVNNEFGNFGLTLSQNAGHGLTLERM